MAQLMNIKILNKLMSEHGQDSSMSAKKAVWKLKGLDRRLGSYVGTSSQVNALIKSLKNNPVGEQTLEQRKAAYAAAGLTPPATEPIQPAPQVSATNTMVTATSAQPTPIAAPTNELPYQTFERITGKKWETGTSSPLIGEYYKKYNITEPAGSAGANLALQKALQGEEKMSASKIVEDATKKTFGTDTTATSATDTTNTYGLTDIPTPTTPTALDVMNTARGYTSTQLAEEQARIEKERLRNALPGDIEQIKSDYASKGLYFSGKRTLAETEKRNTEIAKELDIDLGFAKILGNAIDKAETELGKNIEEVIKDAKDNRKEEVDFLNSVGLAVDPKTGKLYPTLAAIKAEESQKQATETFNQRLLEHEDTMQQREFDNQVKIKQLNISAQNARTSAERNAILDQIRQVNLLNLTAVSPGQIVNASTGLPAKLTETQRTKYAGYDNLINTYVPKLRDLLSKVTTGGVSGRIMSNIGTIPVLQETLNEDQQDLVTTLKSLANERLYTQSGAQINEQEFKRIVATLPRLEYTNAQNQVQLNNLEQIFKDIYSNKLKIEGLGIAADNPVNTDNLIIAPDGTEVMITD